jgi:hypothetical protein
MLAVAAPPTNDMAPLQQLAQQNRQHPAELFAEFLRYFAYCFDAERYVVRLTLHNARTLQRVRKQR